MTLDQALLNRARTAGRELADAERQVVLARAEYHTAIRRLHLGGGPLREIAQALALSHQRVQQIVNAAGGSWWRRAWHTRTTKRDAVCTWCDRPPSEVSKLIAGPNVYICGACVESAERAAAGIRDRSAARRQWSIAESGRCAFCSRRRTSDRSLVTAAAGSLCSNCMRSCREILDGRSANG